MYHAKVVTENRMVANPENFQLMLLETNSDQNLCLKIDDQIIKQCQKVKLLGVTIDSQELCSKVNKQVSAYPRIKNRLDNNQTDIMQKNSVGKLQLLSFNLDFFLLSYQ